jgi:hypothetical protein
LGATLGARRSDQPSTSTDWLGFAQAVLGATADPANRSRRRSETYGPEGWGLGLINNSVSATSGGRRRIACSGATAGRRTSIANLSIGVASAGRKGGLCVVVRHSMPGVVLIAAVSLVVFFNASRVVEAVGIAAGLCLPTGESLCLVAVGVPTMGLMCAAAIRAGRRRADAHLALRGNG